MIGNIHLLHFLRYSFAMGMGRDHEKFPFLYEVEMQFEMQKLLSEPLSSLREEKKHVSTSLAHRPRLFAFWYY